MVVRVLPITHPKGITGLLERTVEEESIVTGQAGSYNGCLFGPLGRDVCGPRLSVRVQLHQKLSRSVCKRSSRAHAREKLRRRK